MEILCRFVSSTLVLFLIFMDNKVLKEAREERKLNNSKYDLFSC